MKLIGLALPAVLPLDNPLGTEPSKSSFYPAGIDFNSTTRVIPSSAKTTTLQHDMQMCSKKTSLMSFRLFLYSSCFMLHEERWPEMTSKMHKRHNRHKLYYRLFGDCRSGSLTEKRLECSALETWKTRNAASVAWQARRIWDLEEWKTQNAIHSSKPLVMTVFSPRWQPPPLADNYLLLVQNINREPEKVAMVNKGQLLKKSPKGT